MTDTSPAALRALSADACSIPGAQNIADALWAIAAEKEAQDCEADAMDAVASEFAHRLAMNLECLVHECPASSRFWNESMETLGAYRSAMNAIHERLSPTHMGEPVFEKEAQHHTEQPLEMVAPADVPTTKQEVIEHQRARMTTRFANRQLSNPTADFDLPQPPSVDDGLPADVPLPAPPGETI